MKKDIAFVFAAAIIAVLMITKVDIKTVDEYYSLHPDAVAQDGESVSLSIQCKDILLNYEQLDEGLRSGDHIPDDGMILPVGEYALCDGDSVFDMLKRVSVYEKISLDYQDLGSVYVRGIDNIYEFSCGPTSGWQYSVNGVTPDISCDKYELNDGDSVEFYYVCDYSAEGGGTFD